MRILKTDMKEGILRLGLQALEDLWHLHKILETGDKVKAKTYRKVAIKRGSEITEGDKKPVLLTIRLEKSEFHKYTGKLRLSGTIVSGPEDIQLASHHTIQLEPGMMVEVEKPSIKGYELDRLKRARVKEADIFIAAIDRDQVDFASLREFGLEMHGSIRYKKIAGDENRGPWYDKIIENLKSQEDFGKILICGPGFERTNLFAYVRKKSPEVGKKVTVEYSSDIGKPGIQEVIKTSGDRILKETRIARETGFVENLLLEIKKRGLEVHKKEDVEKAVEYGALDTLMVSDIKVREFEELIDQSENISAKIAIISTEHQAGEQFLSLGGIGGLLRFKMR